MIRALVVVGRTPDGRCGHCGSTDVGWVPGGHWCFACFHWMAYWGPVPAETSWERLATSFNGARG